MAETAWWQRGIVYQIYPRSFQDSNGDGIGDLGGIYGRLDYLCGLGVDAVWISPIYPSPMVDFGYDITDYCDVDRIFGTLDSFDRMLAAAHARGLKVILDFVPNHTSERHPWFVESRSSKVNSKRNWYLWRDPAPDGGPPNNWLANFGGSGWTFDTTTGQYYYHAFLEQQPDLNWRNPAVREAMYSVLRFRLDRGVDGFRVDVLWLLIKDAQFRDNPVDPAWQPHQPNIDRLLQVHSADQPEVLDVVAEMRAVLDDYADRVLIGEIYLPVQRLVAYYGTDMRGAHLPFNFQLIFAPWTAPDIARIVAEYEQALPKGGWPNWVIGNHDQRRIATRIGAQQARLAAMLLLTLRGTPTLYYGEELGLKNVPIATDRAQDPWERNEPGLGLGRDPERTPMPWDSGVNAGFTSGTPWLPLNADHATCNVATLTATPRSILNLYRRLIALRRNRASLHSGDILGIHADGEVLVYERCHAEDRRLLVVLNLGGSAQNWVLPANAAGAQLLLSSELDRDGEILQDIVALRSAEGVILETGPRT